MRIRSISIAIVVIFFSMTALSRASERIETRIGPFDVADSPMKESALISLFGQGYVQIDKVGDKIFSKKHIYYIPDEKIWMAISLSHVLDKKLERVVESVLVTRNKLCDKKFKLKKSFGPLFPGKGIKIGDSIDKIIETYGVPSVVSDLAEGNSFSVLREELKLRMGKILRYLPNRPDELFFMEFYFGDDGLHSILISGSE